MVLLFVTLVTPRLPAKGATCPSQLQPIARCWPPSGPPSLPPTNPPSLLTPRPPSFHPQNPHCNSPPPPSLDSPSQLTPPRPRPHPLPHTPTPTPDCDVDWGSYTTPAANRGRSSRILPTQPPACDPADLEGSLKAGCWCVKCPDGESSGGLGTVFSHTIVMVFHNTCTCVFI